MKENLKTTLHEDKETLDKKSEKLDKILRSEKISLPREVVERMKNE